MPRVFDGTLVSTAILLYRKALPARTFRLKVLNDDNVASINSVPASEVKREDVVTPEGAILVYQEEGSRRLIDRLNGISQLLADVAQVRTGVMGFEYWSLDKWISDANKGPRIATNSYIERYGFLWGKTVRIYKREVSDPRLDTRCNVLSKNTLELFSTRKVIVRGVAKRLTASLDEEGTGLLVAVHAVVGKQYSDRFLLGLLNSKLFNWLHIIQFYSARIPEGSLRYPVSFLSQLPVVRLDLDSAPGKKRHDAMVELVNDMLSLNSQQRSCPNDMAVSRKIADKDRQIDELVYKLYGLTPDEIAIVERKTC